MPDDLAPRKSMDHLRIRQDTEMKQERFKNLVVLFEAKV